MEKNLFAELEQIAFSEGIAKVGVANIENVDFPIHEEFTKVGVGQKINRALVMAFRLSEEVLNSITDHPTRIYFYHYRRANILMDQAALKIMVNLQKNGYKALPVPSSQTIDWDKQLGHISHRHLAYLAGIGWFGRNNLLVTPEFGSQVRLVSVLTDAPLEPALNLLDNACGACRSCINACPAKAIKEDSYQFARSDCLSKIKEFKDKYHIGHYICGVCIKNCSRQIREAFGKKNG